MCLAETQMQAEEWESFRVEEREGAQWTLPGGCRCTVQQAGQLEADILHEWIQVHTFRLV